MKPLILSLGACLLLTITQTWAKSNNQKQTQSFDKWNSESATRKSMSEDFVIEETDGSGKDGMIEHTHEDDDDFKVISGDGPNKGISIPDIDIGATVTEATKDKNMEKGITDDEDLVTGSGSGQGPVEEDTIDPVDAKPDNLGSPFKDVPSTPTPKPLTPCENLQFRSLNLTQFVPECDMAGAFKKIQCRTEMETYCWCVDLLGTEILGTKFKEPNKPDCENAAVTKSPTFKAITTKTATIKSLPGLDKDNPVIDTKEENIDVKIDGKVEDDERDDEINNEPTMHEPILAQPHLLAAIIGGAAVGLLCIVMLMIFIVYRMRKKDAGSYPLDEQKYQNYTYTKAPEKEFFA